MCTRIFLSWCHQDKALKEALLRDLLPALGVFTDLDVEWWEDSHLTCGEELTAGIVDRLDEADFGLLLLSTRFFGRAFIRHHELPRFAGPRADKWKPPAREALRVRAAARLSRPLTALRHRNCQQDPPLQQHPGVGRRTAVLPDRRMRRQGALPPAGSPHERTSL